MRLGDPLKIIKQIRSQKTGIILPREGTFVRAVDNLGRKLILVNFGTAGEEYLFPTRSRPGLVGINRLCTTDSIVRFLRPSVSMKMKCGDYSSTTIPPSSDRATIRMSKNPNRPKQNSQRTYSAAYFSLEFPAVLSSA